jgi:hypothetical protein
MRTKIDWLSFTVKIATDNSSPEAFGAAIEKGFEDVLLSSTITKLFLHTWKERKGGRAPYNISWDVGETGLVVFASEKLGHVLIECSGKACDYIRSVGVENELLVCVQNRLSRIDIAADMETSASPDEFVKAKTGRKERSIAAFDTDTGSTRYIGSMKSESYVRVYRYNEPHPRHKLLRVEFVFRRKHARTIASEVIVQGINNVAAALGKKRGFAHPAWQPESDFVEDFRFPRPEREASGTVFWLIKSAAPAFKRLVKEGVIDDPEQFLLTYFMGDEGS